MTNYNFDELDKDDKFKEFLNNNIKYMSENCSDMLIKSFVNSSYDKVAPL